MSETAEKTKKSRPKYNTLQNVGWMLQNAWHSYKSVPFACLLTAAIAVALNLIQLFLAPQILSKVEQAAPLPVLLGTIGGFSLALFLVRFLQGYMEEARQSAPIGVRTLLVRQMDRKACTMSYSLTQDEKITRLRLEAARCTSSNQSAGEYIWTTLSDFLAAAAGFVIYLTMLSHLDPVLLAVVLVTCGVSALIGMRTSSWSYRHREESSVLQEKIDYIQRKSESVTMAKDIRIFGLAGWMEEIYQKSLKLYGDFLGRFELVRFAGDAADVLFTVARNGAAYFYLITMALREGMSASEFLLYFTAVSGFTAWITNILRAGGELRRQSLDLNQVRAYLELEEPFRFEGGSPIPEAECYELRLEDVSYRYPEAEADTIHGLSLTIRPGEKVAVVGLNGAGKTTLVKLLCGLLDPTEGRVLLNGQDIRSFDRRKYYKLFSAVFQDFSLLNVTVAETVAQDWRDIDPDRVADCLEQAGLTEKIAGLPKGVDSHIGREVFEDGVLLSGGETQRLMLARALYKNGPILLLDEPTAALDPLAENDIYLKYNEMTNGRTALFISHRLASTRFCDRILFLGGGAVLEEGTHQELLDRGGAYAELFEVQSRYYREGREF